MKGGLNMTYKQIEASREIRLWIGQVIVPAITMGTIAMSNPNVRNYVSGKCEEIKQKFKTKCNKVKILKREDV